MVLNDWFTFVFTCRSRDGTEANRHSAKSSAPQRPRPPLVYTIRNNNNNDDDDDDTNSSSGRGGKVAEPSRAAPAPPTRPPQPAAYSVSTGVSILPSRAAPAKPTPPSSHPPAKPPHLSQTPAKPSPPSARIPTKPPPPSQTPAMPPQPPEPPAKPPKPGASGAPPTEVLDPRQLRPVAAARSDVSRPPLPQKPAVS